jgi:hypothetical protein
MYLEVAPKSFWVLFVLVLSMDETHSIPDRLVFASLLHCGA